MKKSILVIDDERDIGFLMKRILESEGHEVTHVLNLRSALDSLAERSFDLVFLDLNLNGEWGLDLIPHLEESDDSTRIAVITAIRNSETRRELERAGIDIVIQKPFKRAEILEVLNFNL
jgi:two-component system response regulator RegA